MSAQNTKLLTREEAAAYLKIKAGTLATWKSSRRYKVPFIRVGRLIRYSQLDLDNWIKSRTEIAGSGSNK